MPSQHRDRDRQGPINTWWWTVKSQPHTTVDLALCIPVNASFPSLSGTRSPLVLLPISSLHSQPYLFPVLIAHALFKLIPPLLHTALPPGRLLPRPFPSNLNQGRCIWSTPLAKHLKLHGDGVLFSIHTRLGCLKARLYLLFPAPRT